MLSSIMLNAKMGPLHPSNSSVRYLIYESPFPGMNQKLNETKIPVFCPDGPGSLFLSCPEGTLVLLRARFDSDKQIGLMLIEEFAEYLSSPSSKRK